MIPLYSRRSWLLALISPIEVNASRRSNDDRDTSS